MNLQMYYNKKAYGGRSLVGRILDMVLFRAIIFSVLFIIVFYNSFSFRLAIIISLLLTTAISIALTLLRRRKTKKFIEKDIESLKEKCLLEELTLMSTKEFSSYINKLLDAKIKDIGSFSDGFTGKYKDFSLFAFHNHPKAQCSVTDILNVYRSANNDKLIVLSLCDFSDDAKTMCENMDIECVSGKKILRIAASKDMLPDENAAKERAEKEMKESLVTLRQIKKNALSSVKIKGYIACGIIIMIWPIFAGFKFYYPIISILCFVIAIITYKKSANTKESTDIGIS